MKFRKQLNTAVVTYAACLASMAYANEIQIKTNKPMQIVYRTAHQNLGDQPVLGLPQTIQVDRAASIPIDLKNYTLAGIVPVSIDGHVLPDTINRFNQPNQCSMAIDKNVTKGILEISVDEHSLKCKTVGGVVR